MSLDASRSATETEFAWTLAILIPLLAVLLAGFWILRLVRQFEPAPDLLTAAIDPMEETK